MRKTMLKASLVLTVFCASAPSVAWADTIVPGFEAEDTEWTAPYSAFFVSDPFFPECTPAPPLVGTALLVGDDCFNGFVEGGSFSDCTAPWTTVFDCDQVPAGPNAWLQLRTYESTSARGQSTILGPFLAGAVGWGSFNLSMDASGGAMFSVAEATPLRVQIEEIYSPIFDSSTAGPITVIISDANSEESCSLAYQIGQTEPVEAICHLEPGEYESLVTLAANGSGSFPLMSFGASISLTPLKVFSLERQFTPATRANTPYARQPVDANDEVLKLAARLESATPETDLRALLGATAWTEAWAREAAAPVGVLNYLDANELGARLRMQRDGIVTIRAKGCLLTTMGMARAALSGSSTSTAPETLGSNLLSNGFTPVNRLLSWRPGQAPRFDGLDAIWTRMADSLGLQCTGQGATLPAIMDALRATGEDEAVVALNVNNGGHWILGRLSRDGDDSQFQVYDPGSNSRDGWKTPSELDFKKGVIITRRPEVIAPRSELSLVDLQITSSGGTTFLITDDIGASAGTDPMTGAVIQPPASWGNGGYFVEAPIAAPDEVLTDEEYGSGGRTLLMGDFTPPNDLTLDVSGEPGEAFTVFIGGQFSSGPRLNQRLEDFLPASGVMTFDINLAPCAGDANEDGRIDFDDLSLLLDSWGDEVSPWRLGDSNGDGLVGFDDLNILLDGWGITCSSVIPDR